MVYFKDSNENGRSYLCVVTDPRAKAATAKHKFPVYPSMLRPDTELNLVEMRTSFPKEMTTRIESRPSYVLKSTLKGKERAFGEGRPSMLGRKIIDGFVRWGANALKVSGEFAYIPLYWEWTEDVIARHSKRLKDANLYDAVYASLYSYDREPNVVRAFCESWCSRTNTLHTEVGEWSVSLWDLYSLGGLHVSGHLYDEAVPSSSALDARDKDGSRLISRACEHLFEAYCFLADQPDYKNGVRAVQWIHYWCKREQKYKKPPQRRSREADSRPNNTHNPDGELPKRSLEWTPEELDIFSKLKAADETERKTTHLAAFLSCWLCVFVLPEHEERLIRPATFEVATQMAMGATFSLAAPVLASIYRGLNKMVNASKPSSSGSFFPAHYLYAWMAHYFDTHYELGYTLLGPMMVRHSGFQGAKYHTDASARELIHGGSNFQASSLVLSKTRCTTVYDNSMLEVPKIDYVISLRTAYLPLRSRESFIIEPYHPTRFSRQFGFYQGFANVLQREPKDGIASYEFALRQLWMLLFEGSHATIVLPGYSPNWRSFTTDAFKRWWCKATVSDLRRDVQLLLSSVDFKKKNKTVGTDIEQVEEVEVVSTSPTPRISKRTADSDSPNDEGDVNFKHCRGEKRRKTDVPTDHVHPPSHQHTRRSSSSSEGTRLVEDPDDSSFVSPRVGGDVRAVSSPTLHEASGMAADLMSEAVTLLGQRLLGQRLLERLKGTPYDQVKDFPMHADGVYECIENLSGDTSSLRGKVGAYVRSVQAFLAASTTATNDVDRLERDISEADENFQSAQAIVEKELQVSDEQSKQLSLIAEKKAALCEEEARLQEKHHQQLEVISAARSRAASFQLKLRDLVASRANVNSLRMMQHELEESRENLDVV